MRFFEAPDAYGDPTIWIDNADKPIPVIRPGDLAYPAKVAEAWPHIVRALTAGPTIESARVVIETLNDEIKALREVNSELNCANSDLNRELTDLRRAMP